MDHVINWVWQGALVAAMTAAVLRLMARTRAHARFLVCWLALASTATLPLLSAGMRMTPTPPIAASAATLGTPIVTMPAAWWTSSSLVMVVGGLWFLWAVGRLAADVVATRRSRARCSAFPADLESRLRCWTMVRTRGRRASLALSRDVGAGAVLGMGRPIVAVAPVLLLRLTPDEIDRVVIHEWAHVQRRDDLLGIAHAMVRLIAGWHPAVWWLERRMLIEREIACDETAVAVTGCPRRYAACLTTIAGLPPAAMAPMSAMGVLSTSALSVRVTRILSGHTLASRTWSTAASVIAMLLLIACSFALAGHRLVEAAEPAVSTALTAPDAAPAEAASAPAEDGSRILPADAGSHTIDSAGGTRRVTSGSGRPSSELGTALTVSMGRTIDRAVIGDLAATAHPAVTAPDLMPLAPTARPLPIIDQRAIPPARVQPQSARTAPWTAIAGAGVSLGRGSQQAGVATAGFFTRFGKRIAGSF
jgi:beta-lactamase regulating signal transducer with metallopeptidase domain